PPNVFKKKTLISILLFFCGGVFFFNIIKVVLTHHPAFKSVFIYFNIHLFIFVCVIFLWGLGGDGFFNPDHGAPGVLGGPKKPPPQRGAV
ncbi:hypothetical protein, partial [Enterobacter mori]